MRLVTRGDLDGLTCAVLITSCEDIDEIVLVHPQDITDKRLHITDDDIIANLPYQSGVGKWFDHHLLTQSNERPPDGFDGRYGLAPSAARMVYEYYVGRRPDLQRYERLLAETDRLAHLAQAGAGQDEPRPRLTRGGSHPSRLPQALEDPRRKGQGTLSRPSSWWR